MLGAKLLPIGTHVVLEGFGVGESDVHPVDRLVSRVLPAYLLWGIMEGDLSPLPEDFPERHADFAVAEDEIGHRSAHSLHGLKCRCSLRDAKAPPSQCSQHQKVRSSAYTEPRCPLPNRRIIASVPRRPCTSRVSSNPSARAFRSFDDAVQVDGRESTRKYLS